MIPKEENDLLTQTGPGTLCGKLMRRYWQPAALSGELPQGRATLPVRFLGEDLVLFRDDRFEWIKEFPPVCANSSELRVEIRKRWKMEDRESRMEDSGFVNSEKIKTSNTMTRYLWHE